MMVGVSWRVLVARSVDASRSDPRRPRPRTFGRRLDFKKSFRLEARQAGNNANHLPPTRSNLSSVRHARRARHGGRARGGAGVLAAPEPPADLKRRRGRRAERRDGRRRARARVGRVVARERPPRRRRRRPRRGSSRRVLRRRRRRGRGGVGGVVRRRRSRPRDIELRNPGTAGGARLARPAERRAIGRLGTSEARAETGTEKPKPRRRRAVRVSRAPPGEDRSTESGARNKQRAQTSRRLVRLVRRERWRRTPRRRRRRSARRRRKRRRFSFFEIFGKRKSKIASLVPRARRSVRHAEPTGSRAGVARRLRAVRLGAPRGERSRPTRERAWSQH